MERINFGYSLKNIPIPPKNSYLKSLIDKSDSFIRRIRWLIFHYDRNNKDRTNNDRTNNDRTNTDGISDEGPKTSYGFPSERTPPQHAALKAFEADLYELINNVSFSNFRSRFQKKLIDDVRSIKSSKHILVPADKTTNIYKVEADKYKQLLTDNVTSQYKTANASTKREIDLEAKKIATKLKLDDRVECIAEREAFVTLKDHKDNFNLNPKCRLINPTKSEIGSISKVHLQEINSEVRQKTKLHQWRNTSSVIDWFDELQHKSNLKLVQLDIVDFYPSITEPLLDEALRFAKSIVEIEESTIDIIKHARKSLLFAHGKTWIKRSNNLFDVTMGSYDGAEICELVGLYMLHVMRERFPFLNFGLYRDDGMGAYSTLPGPATDRLRKDIVKLFKDNGLGITIEMNTTIANFLDATFNLSTGKYQPYRKPNDEPLYINKNSNHPPTILKRLPKLIERRISELSYGQDEFNSVKKKYETALMSSGHNAQLTYNKPTPKHRTRKRNVIFFNPPFNAAVSTNIGREFLKLIDKHFPAHNPYHKIFNRNTIKLSYSCSPNMKSIISNQNKHLLKGKPNDQAIRTCNCRSECPLPGNGDCRSSSVIYKTTISSENSTKVYIGSTESDVKIRIANHKHSFRNATLRNATRLSTYVHELQDQEKQFNVKWEIQAKSTPYQCGTRRCNLCIAEKFEILRSDPTVTLNTRSEIANKCRHSSKFKLRNIR